MLKSAILVILTVFVISTYLMGALAASTLAVQNNSVVLDIFRSILDFFKSIIDSMLKMFSSKNTAINTTTATNTTTMTQTITIPATTSVLSTVSSAVSTVSYPTTSLIVSSATTTSTSLTSISTLVTTIPLTTVTTSPNASCYTIDKSNSVYSLSADVLCSTTSAGAVTFSKGVNNTILNCNGHRIIYSAYSLSGGINFSSNNSNDVIENCNVDVGKNPYGYSCSGMGIIVRSSSKIAIVNTTVAHACIGIDLLNTNNSTILDDSLTNDTFGIFVDASSWNKVEFNTVSFSYSAAITISGGSGTSIKNRVENNLCEFDLDDGILLNGVGDSRPVEYNLIENNTVAANYDGGIELVNASSNIVRDNTAIGNGVGIFYRYPLPSWNNTIEFNRLYSNGYDLGLNWFQPSGVTTSTVSGNENGTIVLSTTPQSFSIGGNIAYSRLVRTQDGSVHSITFLNITNVSGVPAAYVRVDNFTLQPITVGETASYSGIILTPVDVTVKVPATTSSGLLLYISETAPVSTTSSSTTTSSTSTQTTLSSSSSTSTSTIFSSTSTITSSTSTSMVGGGSG